MTGKSKLNHWMYFITMIVLFNFIMFSSETSDNAYSIERKLREFVKESMACQNRKDNPALSVSVVKEGKLVFAEGFGRVDGTDPTSRQPDEDTIFGIASLTKAFTAALLVKLMHEKGIPLTTHLRDKALFGNDHLFENYELRKYATVKDALAHRMGFALNNYLRFNKNRKQDIFHMAKHMKTLGSFRASFYYSNTMYGLMTTLIERLGGDNWENLMTEHILHPIGMTSTIFGRTADFTQLNVAQGCVNTAGTLNNIPPILIRKWSDLCGSGSLFSSARDMAKWMNFQLRKGKNDNNETVMEDKVLNRCFQEENVIPTRSIKRYMKYYPPSIAFSQDVYMLGWRKGYYRGSLIYTHTGTTLGSSAMVMLFPSKKLGIYVGMTGRDVDFFFRTITVTYIADLYLGEKPWITANQSCDFPTPLFYEGLKPKQVIKRDIKAFRPLTAYQGVYFNTLYGSFVVTLNATNSILYLVYGWAEFRLFPQTQDGDKDKFFMEGQGDLLDILNFSECVFHFDGTDIYSISMTSWDRKDVPVFIKESEPFISKYLHTYSLTIIVIVIGLALFQGLILSCDKPKVP